MINRHWELDQCERDDFRGGDCELALERPLPEYVDRSVCVVIPVTHGPRVECMGIRWIGETERKG